MSDACAVVRAVLCGVLSVGCALHLLTVTSWSLLLCWAAVGSMLWAADLQSLTLTASYVWLGMCGWASTFVICLSKHDCDS